MSNFFSLRLLNTVTVVLSLSLLSVSVSSAVTFRPPFSCDESNPATKSLPFCNTGLPISTRVRDLASRLSLDEKIQQMGSSSYAIPRLNISAYQWWSESIHGVSNGGLGFDFFGKIRSATQFPQVILTAASFDPHLWYRIAQAISDEGRALFNAAHGRGMTFMAPNVNLFRDPRWGRGQETPGEEPLVAAKYAVAYVRGIQGDSFEGDKLGRLLKASACCKHLTAYDMERWNGTDRSFFDAKVSKQDMAEMYQPPFEACVKQGKATGMMCAYNRVNGIPTCADRNLLYNIPRKQWGFHGYVISDCDSVRTMFDAQHYGKEPEDVVTAALKAGLDVDCGKYFLEHAKAALAKKKISIADINRALHNALSMRMRLGLFDGNTSKLEYGELNRSHVCSKKHQHLALEAARSGIVLLKNQLGLLPLSIKDTKSIALIGPNANNPATYNGNYHGPPCKPVSFLQALHDHVHNINIMHHPGCHDVNCTSNSSIHAALELAREADYVLLLMGLDQTQEREYVDRIELRLPGHQQQLATAVADAAARPVVLVLVCGGPLDVSFAKHNPKIASILWLGYPGEAGDIALVQTLFGHNNPGGRLPMTWYPEEYNKLVKMTDMRMRPDPSTAFPGRTYRFYTGPTVFEFGHGLSYTNYYYDFAAVTLDNLYLQRVKEVESNNAVLNHPLFNSSSRSHHHHHHVVVSVSELGKGYCKKMRFSAYVRVTNHGGMAGKHPVLLFVRSGDGSDTKSESSSMYPRKRLVGFESLTLGEGESKEIEFVVKPCDHFSYADEQGKKVIQQGRLRLVVGDKEHPIDIII